MHRMPSVRSLHPFEWRKDMFLKETGDYRIDSI